MGEMNVTKQELILSSDARRTFHCTRIRRRVIHTGFARSAMQGAVEDLRRFCDIIRVVEFSTMTHENRFYYCP